MIHPSYTEEIEHLDFDVPCGRCKVRNAEFIVAMDKQHGCFYDNWRGYFCSDCVGRGGNCNACGTPGFYEAIA